MVPYCVKCSDRIVIEGVMSGCAQNPKIHNYADAKKYCPLTLNNDLKIDAIACSNDDYNTWEENQIAQDNE